MFVATTPNTTEPKKWRSLSFSLVTGLLAVALMAVAGSEFLTAWILRDPTEDIHLWHIAELVALLVILLGGALLSLLHRPQDKPLLAQFFAIGLIIAAIAVMPFEIKAAGLLLVVPIFIAVYPDFRALFSTKREGRVSIAMLVLTLLLALYLAPAAWRELHWQIAGMTEHDIHALDFHWIGSVVLYILLFTGGLLAATKRPGWKQLGLIVGGAYCYLGLTAMIVPFYAGSWGAAIGLFGIIAGIFYMLIVLLETQSAAQSARDAVAQSASAGETLPDWLSEATRSREPAATQESLPAYTARKLSGMLEATPRRTTQHLVHSHA